MVPTVKIVVLAPEVQFTWEACVASELERKLEPVSERLTGIVAAPATAVLGVMLVRTGSGFGDGLMTIATGLERPLRPAPVAGLNVMMVATPGFATRAGGTFAVMMLPRIFPALSVGSVDSRVFPFHWTTVPFLKMPPFTVSVKSLVWPALMTEGEIERMVAPVLF